jgi:hypothetical protein
MAMNQRKKVYRTMQGKTVDIDLLRQRNELTPAVGNVKVNARGDELGPGGKIVRKKEEVLKDYYGGKNGMPDQSPVSRKKATNEVEKDLTDDWEEPAPKATAKKTTAKKESVEVDTSGGDWVEDADGNFVPKGE